MSLGHTKVFKYCFLNSETSNYADTYKTSFLDKFDQKLGTSIQLLGLSEMSVGFVAILHGQYEPCVVGMFALWALLSLNSNQIPLQVISWKSGNILLCVQTNNRPSYIF